MAPGAGIFAVEGVGDGEALNEDSDAKGLGSNSGRSFELPSETEAEEVTKEKAWEVQAVEKCTKAN